MAAWGGTTVGKRSSFGGRGHQRPIGGRWSTGAANEPTLSDAFEKDREETEKRLEAVGDIMNEYKTFENPWLNKDVFSDPLFQRISRSNRGTAANTFKALQSGVSGNLGARGIRGSGPESDLRYEAANESLRQLQESENALAKELTSLFHSTGVARESILGSLMNANINAIMGAELPDYSGEWFDTKSFESWDKAMRDAMEASAASENPFLEEGTFSKWLLDAAEAFTPALMPFTMFRS